MEDKRLVSRQSCIAFGIFRWAIIRRFVLGEVRIVEPGPFFFLGVPPDQFLSLAPWLSVRPGRRPVVDDPTIRRPGVTPTMTVKVARLAKVGVVFATFREAPGVNPCPACGAPISFQVTITGNEFVVRDCPAV